jgi:hypothetical protein
MSLMGLAARDFGAARMGQINPFTGAMPLPPTLSAAERNRRSRADSKNLPADEASEHVVENPDAVTMISDDHSHQSPDKEEQHKEEADDPEKQATDSARLDVTA